MVLTRLLLPYEFGLIAVVMVFVTFFSLMTEMGIGPAIVQQMDFKKNDYDSIFTLTIFAGIIFGGIFYFSASYVACFYKDNAYVNIVHCLSLVVIFSTWSIVPRALLIKQQNFSYLTKTNVSINLIFNVLSIYLASIGWSYYAILFRSISSSIVIFLSMILMLNLKITVEFRKNTFQKIYKFSIFQFAFNFINYFSRNLDKILIGKYLGTEILGLYDKAYMLMLLPVNNITHVLTPVLQTSLVNYQGNMVMVYDAYLKIIKILALVGIPISVMCYNGAYEIIDLFFGERWLGIVPVFRIFAISIWIQVVLASSGSIFQVVNRTDLLFVSGVISAILMISAIVIGVFQKRLDNIAIYLTVAFVLNFFQGYYLLIVCAMKQNISRFLKVLYKPLAIGVIMEIVICQLGIEFESSILSLSCKMVILGVTYFIGLHLFNELENIKRLFR